MVEGLQGLGNLPDLSKYGGYGPTDSGTTHS